MLVRLRDVPQLPKRKFHYRNSCAYLMSMTPCNLDTATGRLFVDRDFQLIGWCANPPSEIMRGRDGQIVMMFANDDDGEMWQHYPLFDQDERDAAIIDCVNPMFVTAHADKEKQR